MIADADPIAPQPDGGSSTSRPAAFGAPRIAIDAGPVAGPRTGVGQATAGLLAALAGAWPEAWPAPVAWINSPRHPLPTADPWLRTKRFQVRHTRYSGKALLRGWQWLDWPRLEGWLGPLDLVHSPSGVVPSVRRARRIVTVHDLYFHHRPEHTDTYGGRYFAATYGRRLTRADAVVCVSAFTRAELLRFYPVDPARAHVIHWGVDFERYHPDPQPGDAAEVEKLGLREPYLICVATQEPRKNLPRLIKAYGLSLARMEERGLAAPQLALVGGTGWGGQDLERLIQRDGLAGHVRLTGYQPAERIPALYRRAMAMVFPPLYEGFGLPAIEAMACGCPCVLSRIEALEEVAGDAAAWFNPLAPDALARLLADVAASPEMRENLKTAGLAQARRFTWESTAKKTIELYRQVLGRA